MEMCFTIQSIILQIRSYLAEQNKHLSALMKFPLVLKYLLFLYFIPVGNISSQIVLQGMVSDRDTREPLPFVALTTGKTGEAVLSQVDGRFSITVQQLPVMLYFKYIGYENDSIWIEKMKPIKVYLQPGGNDLKEIEVLPGINPAHRIIENAAGNAHRNNPEKNIKYRSVWYNKFVFNVEYDSIFRHEALTDSSKRQALEFSDSQHIFLMESVTARLHVPPDLTRETVLANRISGFENPTFSMFATQLQSFTFYPEQIPLMGISYLNPISKGSTSRYFFQLEDTLYTGENDTVFIISYRPVKNAKFNGLKGMLFIRSATWGIQNVTAEPYASNGMFKISIQQEYQFENGYWFPHQLNTQLITAITDTQGSNLIGRGTTYLHNKELDAEVRKNEVSDVAVDYDEDANRRDETFWQQYRHMPPDAKDIRTYHVIDSIGKEANLDKMAQVFEIMVSGKIPVGIINIDLNRLLRYNGFERLRLGIGAHTNHRLSKHFSIGGFIGYGFRDKDLKYGGDTKIVLHRSTETAIYLQYERDITEPGVVRFAGEEKGYISPDTYRDLYPTRFDRTERFVAAASVRFLRNFKLTVTGEHRLTDTFDEYSFIEKIEQVSTTKTFYATSMLTATLRIAIRERFVETPVRRVSMGTKYPIIYLQYTQGFKDILKADFQFQKLDIKAFKAFQWKTIGKTSITLQGGIVNGTIPLGLQYGGWGTYSQFGIFTPTAFETMRINEFYADRYASVFMSHHFGTSLFGKGKFRPQPEISFKSMTGLMNFSSQHSGVDFKIPEHGYYEAGVAFHSIISSGISGIGISTSYRFGAYTLPRVWDNFAVKITLNYTL